MHELVDWRVGDTEGSALFEACTQGPLRCLEQNVVQLEPLDLAVSALQGQGLSGNRVGVHRFAFCNCAGFWKLVISQVAAPHPIRCHSSSGREGSVGRWLVVCVGLGVCAQALLHTSWGRGPDSTDLGRQPLDDSGGAWTLLVPLTPLTWLTLLTLQILA